MAENFVTIRKVIRFLRKMLFNDVKSRPVHMYVYTSSIQSEQMSLGNRIPLKKTFLSSVTVKSTQKRLRSQMDFYVAKQSPSHNFVVLHANRWGVAQHISTKRALRDTEQICIAHSRRQIGVILPKKRYLFAFRFLT
jgi:hypothetical protein